MGSYFYGWYYRVQSAHQTLAVIPSVHTAKGDSFCSIQLITDTNAYHFRFPFSYYRKHGNVIFIADNRFGPDGIALDIRQPGCFVTGQLQFGAFIPIRYDIMGPFRYLPFMQCRHRIFSMNHPVYGSVMINDTAYHFYNAAGYMEGDQGYSFPKEYLWTQCSFPEGALMLSIAQIPMGTLTFKGVIGVVLLRGKEYRLATYLGARVMKITPKEIIVVQGNYTLTVKPQDVSGHPLLAPVQGAMKRTIHEHPSCRIYYRFACKGVPLLDVDAYHAAFEYEYYQGFSRSAGL